MCSKSGSIKTRGAPWAARAAPGSTRGAPWAARAAPSKTNDASRRTRVAPARQRGASYETKGASLATKDASRGARDALAMQRAAFATQRAAPQGPRAALSIQRSTFFTNAHHDNGAGGTPTVQILCVGVLLVAAGSVAANSGMSWCKGASSPTPRPGRLLGSALPQCPGVTPTVVGPTGVGFVTKQPGCSWHGETPPSATVVGSCAHGVTVPRQLAAPPLFHEQPISPWHAV